MHPESSARNTWRTTDSYGPLVALHDLLELRIVLQAPKPPPRVLSQAAPLTRVGGQVGFQGLERLAVVIQQRLDEDVHV